MLDMVGIAVNEVIEEMVGFQIVFCLNVLGCLDDFNFVIDLLIGFDDEEVYEIVFMIYQKNEECKEIVQFIYEEVKIMVDFEKKV